MAAATTNVAADVVGLGLVLSLHSHHTIHSSQAAVCLLELRPLVVWQSLAAVVLVSADRLAFSAHCNVVILTYLQLCDLMRRVVALTAAGDVSRRRWTTYDCVNR